MTIPDSDSFFCPYTILFYYKVYYIFCSGIDPPTSRRPALSVCPVHPSSPVQSSHIKSSSREAQFTLIRSVPVYVQLTRSKHIHRFRSDHLRRSLRYSHRPSHTHLGNHLRPQSLSTMQLSVSVQVNILVEFTSVRHGKSCSNM